MDVHEPNGLLWRAARRAGNPGDGDGRHRRPAARERRRAIAAAVSAETAPCSFDRLRGNAELRLLDLVRVRDDAAEEDVTRAGNRGQALGHEAAGARLGGADRQPERAAESEDDLLDRPLVLREEVAVEPCAQLGAEGSGSLLLRRARQTGRRGSRSRARRSSLRRRRRRRPPLRGRERPPTR